MKQLNILAARQKGVTLIELLVSVVIGMVIMVAVISAYIGASSASRTAEATGRMNEDAQMALTILSQQLRMAGVNPSQPNRSSVTVGLNPRGNSVPLHNTLTNAYAIRGCDIKFSNMTSAANTGALTCGHASGSTGPAAIAVAYEADRYNTVPTSSGAPTDCLGNPIGTTTFNFTNASGVAASTSVYEAENRFYIGTSTYIVNPTLYCKGNGNANGQPLVENIEDLQITYGTVNPNGGFIYKSQTPTFTATQVLGYLSAFNVENDTTTLNGLSNTARWNAVKTVRICVVVRSENAISDSLAAPQYLNCAGVLTTAADKRLRRAYTTTVILRNQ